MTQLSVNVNKLATLRNSRGKNLPDVAEFARKILEYGAHGITVHPRPDGRHIRQEDAVTLAQLIANWNDSRKRVEFNVEGYPSGEFLQLIERIRPHQCTLVPDPPEAITSNAGWDLAAHEAELKKIIKPLQDEGIRVSLFVEPAKFTERETEALGRILPDRIELYTEAYADHYGKPGCESIIHNYDRTAKAARQFQIGVNAGHDLNQKNLGYLIQKIEIDEVSIGHALVCEALEDGFAKTIANYLKILQYS